MNFLLFWVALTVRNFGSLICSLCTNFQANRSKMVSLRFEMMLKLHVSFAVRKTVAIFLELTFTPTLMWHWKKTYKHTHTDNVICLVGWQMGNQENPIVSKFQPRIHLIFYLCFIFLCIWKMFWDKWQCHTHTHTAEKTWGFSDSFGFYLFGSLKWIYAIRTRFTRHNAKCCSQLNAPFGHKMSAFFPNQFVIRAH